MKKFKRGDTREDGKVFFRYKNNREIWVDYEKLVENRLTDTEVKNKQSLDKLGHAKKIFTGRKKYSKANSIPFEISFEDVSDLPEKCPVLGISLTWGIRKGQAGNKNDSPSMDRFDPELGYVKGNVFWISGLANRIKSNFSTEQLTATANWMQKIESNQVSSRVAL